MNNMSQTSNQRNICLNGFYMFVCSESSGYNAANLVPGRNQIEASVPSIKVSSVKLKV
jgi:hypothetical protein